MSKRVVILGGGVGGLTAAHELIERGFDVELHEARTVIGGKARTIYVPGTGQGGRPDLPGEHGFRFFPSFYKHLPDTMSRIPFRGQRHGVRDNLVQATEYLMAVSPTKNLELLVKLPDSIQEWKEALTTVWSAFQLDIPAAELAYFVDRLMVILTSCPERRLAEYEQIAWWDFIDADAMSDAYRTFLATGLTRSLVAMKAEEGSTRTVGDILIQLLLGVYAPNEQFDRVLNGPTSEVWIEPWITYLKDRGVVFHLGSSATEIACSGGRITGVTVTAADGTTRVVDADHYISAMPVERLQPLINAAMRSADPSLARIDNLRVAWMNGFQFFLREDQPLVNGHANFVSQPWALTSISQSQFWPAGLTGHGDGTVKGCLSIDISDWEANGILSGRSAKDAATREEIKKDVAAQIVGSLRPDLAGILDESNIHTWFLDPDIVLPNPSGTVNLEPLLINTAGSWQYRPEAATGIENLFLAADFVRTYTDLATMEGANEAARRAVNSILARTASSEPPCHVWPLHEPLLLLPLREYDLLRFKLGLPHSSVGALRRPSAPHAEAFSPPPAAPPEDAVAAGISPFEAAPVPSRHRRRMTTMAVSEAATTRPMPAETPPPTR
jgi:uncharacterized protein with NAD-binding domain and iron-sulfur cluster